MSVSNAVNSPAVAVDPQAELRVDCYVRSVVPGPITERVNAIIERLQRLSDRGHITEYQISLWPRDCHAAADVQHTQTRGELVAEFERWAAQHGHSLEPAFRRQEIPASPLGRGDPQERVRVPVVALALYEADGTERDSGTASLRGVVPYTAQRGPYDHRSYTVDEWLSAVESGES